MATQDDSTSNNNLVPAYFANNIRDDGPLYMIIEDNKNGMHDQLNAQLSRLSSMLQVISRDGYKNFSEYNE
jgi:hypothetical protein